MILSRFLKLNSTRARQIVFSSEFTAKSRLANRVGRKTDFLTTTGTFTAYAHEVSLSVLEIEVFTKVYFAEDENFRRNVLGRQGFLDHMKLGLIDYEGKLLLSAYNK